MYSTYNYLHRSKIYGPGKECFENTTEHDLTQVSKYYNLTESSRNFIKGKIRQEDWRIIVRNGSEDNKLKQLLISNGCRYKIIRIKDLPKKIKSYKKTYPIVLRGNDIISTVDPVNKRLIDGYDNTLKLFPGMPTRPNFSLIHPAYWPIRSSIRDAACNSAVYHPSVFTISDISNCNQTTDLLKNGIKQQRKLLIVLNDFEKRKMKRFTKLSRDNVDLLRQELSNCFFLEEEDCGPYERFSREVSLETNLNTPTKLLDTHHQFEKKSFIAKGKYGSVFNIKTTELGELFETEWVVKKLNINEEAVNEIPLYRIASELGFGVSYYGWGICGGYIFIFMEKMAEEFNRHRKAVNNPETISKLINLVDTIASSGYYSADFHTANIMYDINGNLKLIDPSLKLIEDRVMYLIHENKQKYVNQSFEWVSGGSHTFIKTLQNVQQHNYKYFGMFFMLNRITCEYGGLVLEHVPLLQDAIINVLSGKKILVIIEPTGKMKTRYDGLPICKIFEASDLCLILDYEVYNIKHDRLSQ
ncbi:MAG: protein kinase family protein [Colwellia sp.]|nr:protein kinase family protein [Colwellia sp.]